MRSRRIVLLGLLSLAEAAVIEPLLLILPSPLRLMDPAIALAVTWGLLFAISGSRRWMALRDAGATVQRLVLGAWLVGMLVVSAVIVSRTQEIDPRSLTILFVEFTAVLIVWWRGLALGSIIFGPDSARLRLQIGLLLFVLIAIATMFLPQYNLMTYLVPFLVGGLFAMPLSHLEWVEQSELGRPMPMDRVWWRAISAGIGVPLLASLAAATIITGDAIGAGLRLLIAVLLLPILAVAFVLGYIITWLASILFSQMKRNPLEGLQNLGDMFGKLIGKPDQVAPAPISIPPELRFALGLLVLAAIIGLLVWLTSRARREEAVLRASSDNLQDLGTVEPPPVESLANGLLRNLSLRRWLAAVTVRRIYARMSHEAGKRGFARLSTQTPYDYLPLVYGAFPGADTDIRVITNAYIAAHYGEVPDTSEALDLIRSAWERVRATPRAAPAAPAVET